MYKNDKILEESSLQDTGLSVVNLISLKHHFWFKESPIVMNSHWRTRVSYILEHWTRTHHVASENLSSLILVPSSYSLFLARLAWSSRSSSTSALSNLICRHGCLRCPLHTAAPPLLLITLFPTPLGLCPCCLLLGAFFLNLPCSWPTNLSLAFLYSGFNGK